jgi:LETM1 and EF-hand domain-containing protein 1
MLTLIPLMQQNRATDYVPTADILKFAPLFKDSITLDSISRPHLKALCRLVQVEPIGT